MKKIRLCKYIIPAIILLFLFNICCAQIENRLNEAIRLSQNGEYDKADNIFSQILLTNPNDDKALTGRGYNSLWFKHYNLAEEDFKKAFQLNPQNMDALAGLAYVLSGNKKYKEAEDKFNIVLGKSSTNYKALEGRAYNNLWSGKYAAAKNDFTLLVEAGITKKEFYKALSQIDSYLNPVVFEIGGSIGAMNSMTDLGGRKGIGKKFVKDYTIKTTLPCLGAYAAVTYRNIVVGRGELSFGYVKAYDGILKDVAASTYGRYERNLSFRSAIYELLLTGEFHPLYLSRDFDEDMENNKLGLRYSPYIMAGIGVFHFNPKANLNGTWIPLHPLHTEGQGFSEYGRKNYKLTQFNFPLGIGVKYQLDKKFMVRAEFVYRFLFTDYLDDVSTTFIDPQVFYKYFTGTKLEQALALYDRHVRRNANDVYTNRPRGRSDNNDSYFSLNIKLGMIIGRQKIYPGEK